MTRAIVAIAVLASAGCEQILGIDEPRLGTGEVTLGMPCGESFGDCGGAGSCVTFIEDHGDPGDDSGYCTPFCDDNSDCRAGYVGPGDPQCVLFDAIGLDPTRCAIVCDTNECPPPLECYTVINDDFAMQNVCGAADWEPIR